ncbi:DUF6801 domain-containing protein [Amycolatopsis sp. NPDC004625]|uniref:DUF6801 domain-containing protein n=1 Tax=Amycolatopsis sp. NPDC004625 TaxID=3154670 RepID=UPI0033BF48A5
MRIAPALAAALLVTGLATEPARAATAFQAGPVGYTCQFPDNSPQTVSLAAGFTGPDTVAPGAGIGLSDVSGSVTLSPAAAAWFTSLGNDGLAGGRVALFTEAVNAPRSTSNPPAATIQPTTWGSGPATVEFTGGRGSHTAGPSGTITFTAGRLILLMSLHRPTGGTSFYSVICRPQDGQDTAFTPALPIR